MRPVHGAIGREGIEIHSPPQGRYYPALRWIPSCCLAPRSYRLHHGMSVRLCGTRRQGSTPQVLEQYEGLQGGCDHERRITRAGVLLTCCFFLLLGLGLVTARLHSNLNQEGSGGIVGRGGYAITGLGVRGWRNWGSHCAV